MKNYLILILLLLLIGGCTSTKPVVRMEKNVSLTKYKMFEVPPVSNETGKTFEFDVANELTQQIKLLLNEKGYTINNENEIQDNILTITNSLIVYEPGNAVKRWLLPGAGATKTIVKTSLIDKKSGEIIGEMLTTKQISGGGLYSVGADKSILKTVAEGIINGIEKNIEGE